MASNFVPDPEMSEICSKLWDLDVNRCEPGVDYDIDLQGYVTSARFVRGDYARCNLFSWLDEDKVFERETYKAFKNLLNNYEVETGRPEEVTAEEQQENCRFIDLIVDTDVMREAHQYLVGKGKAPEDENAFKRLLYDIWFRLYKRSREDRHLDSSGFEHVFVGETRQQDVIGFHNWLQFYLQEKRGHIDYRGYFRRGTANEDSPRLITLQFVWKDGQEKPIGSSFIGTSPEFEMALYTLVFLAGEHSKVPVLISDYEVEVVCYRHGRGIGTAYPNSMCD
ncbi:hypothetical protein NP493_315g03068 [Ridgeia piscesae]|uniref:Uridylate-specific endoribonuclease n=1 Tax=Ridgeia piscesae TaxID=27915 RepID=A0AAD9L4R8_RIDPI|nr:hypothetical protein NP493_315g03068 [Ridgeia piscesae]